MSCWKVLALYFEALARASREADFCARRPGSLSIRKVEQMAAGFRYTVSLPAVDPVDLVTTRELSVARDGAVDLLSPAPTAATVPVEVLASVARMVLILTDIDQAGNRSLPSEPLAFDVTDTVPPHQPGALGITAVEQVDLPEEPTP